MVLKGARQRQRVPGAGATPFESAWETAVRGAAVQSGPTMAAGAGPGGDHQLREARGDHQLAGYGGFPGVGGPAERVPPRSSLRGSVHLHGL